MTVDGLLQEAIRFHRLGSLAEAERLYASILQQDPDHADALHLLGVMACKFGRYQGGHGFYQQGHGPQPERAGILQ